MKRLVFILIIIILLGGGFYFYQKNLKGIWPAISSPSQDITKIIPQKPQENIPGKNETDYPLKIPDNFSISIFAKNLGPARVLAQAPDGTIIVSITKSGKILALPGKNNDGVADETITLASGLNNPHGLAFNNCNFNTCDLYVAQENKVSLYSYQINNPKITFQKDLFSLPQGGRHFTRTLLINDNKLFTSVGSTCDVCYEKDGRLAAILSSDLDGENVEVFAKGLRNSVFITLRPKTQEIWATEMSRDFLGDNLPPDEINIVKQGKDYGWPICYGKNVHDRQFDTNVYKQNPCNEKEPSYVDIPAHSAPLGLAFIPPESSFPKEYWYNLLVAYHGSWNKTVPIGYKIVRYKLDENGKYLDEEDFISGWLTSSNEALGRPVDILVDKSGKIYISDDKAGVIYLVKD